MKVSVITINYNNRAGLEKTIQSVITQTYTDFEYIVIDGGSDDGSVQLIETKATSLTYWVTEKDEGIYHAMNKGIRAATGEYCLFLNSGDELVHKDVLKNVMARNRTEDIIYGNMIIDYGNGKTEKGFMPGKISLHQMIKDTLWHPVSFIKRTLLIELNCYDEQLFIAADYDFFLKAILIKKCSTYHIRCFVAVFSMDGISSQPANREKLAKERKAIQLRYFNQEEIDAAMKVSLINKIRQLIRKIKA